MTDERIKKLVAEWRKHSATLRNMLGGEDPNSGIPCARLSGKASIYDTCADELEHIARESEDKDE